jgi:hypothetical protein
MPSYHYFKYFTFKMYDYCIKIVFKTNNINANALLIIKKQQLSNVSIQ